MTLYSGGRVALRLAFRVLRPASRLEWVASLVSLLAAMLVVVAVCVGIGSAGEAKRHDDVLWLRTPTASPAEGPRSMVCQIVMNTASGSLEVQRFGTNDAHAGSPIGAPWPAVGTVWVSPRLAQLLQGDDPLLKTLVPGQVKGIIADAALTDPDDLLAYVGVDAATVAASPCYRVVGFKNSLDDNNPSDAGISNAVTAISFAAIGMAGCVALLAASQLMAGSRERRLAAAVLIGMRPRTLSWVGAASCLVWAIGGALLGLAALWPVGQLLATWPTFGVKHWATVALVPWPMRLAVVLVVVILATIMGYKASVQDAWAVRRRTGDTTKASVWRAVPLVAALICFGAVLINGLHIGSQQASQLSDSATYLLLTGLVLGAIGLVSAQPVITSWLRPLVAGGPLSLRLAVARHAHSASATRWFALGLAVGVLGLGMSSGMTSGLSGRLQTEGSSNTVIVDLPPKAAWAKPAAFDAAVAQIFQSHSMQWATTMDWGSPSQDANPSQPPPVPTPQQLIDPSSLSNTAEVQAAMDWSDASAVVAIAVAGWQDSHEFPSFTMLSQDLDQGNRLLMEVVSLGLVLAIGLVTFSVGTALVGLQARREDADASLLAVGLPYRRLVVVRAWEAAVAALPLGVVAMVLSCLAAIGLQHVDDTTLPIDWGMLAPIVITPFAVTLLAAVAAAVSTPRADHARVRRD